MIDGIRPRRRPAGVRPVDRQHMAKMVVGDHSNSTSSKPRSAVLRMRSKIAPAAGAPILAAATADASEPPANPPSGGPGDTPGQEPFMPGAELPTDPAAPPEPPKEKVSFLDKLRNLDKKQWIIIITIAVLLIGAGVAAYFMFFKKDAPPPKPRTTVQKKVEPPKPKTVAATLTGIQVDPAVNQRPVVGVMIENSPDARPQSSLDTAGVVFEAVAEGGITRFLALYQDTDPPYIGPVRSVRPYYVQWAMGFDAGIAHVGGSPEALASIKEWGARDLDQFAGGSYFSRITSRYAPHNVYTSITKLREYATNKGFTSSTYTGFARKVEKAVTPPTARVIDLNISSAFYNAHYDYEPTTNSYKRSQGGEAHTEVAEDGTVSQISPKVVVALVMPQGLNGKYTTYQTIGSGKAYVFQDGTLTEGSWRKEANGSQFIFSDAAGAQLKLNPGQTWISVVGDAGKVTYQP